ncbi:hypothetical protein GBF38_002644 [Nibea albiflora]|uniref:Uncharacterized protein n=1 Tax=Nibea albiflora TaxID=240163 RepID=A0ACB7EE17_NIBAL|nr:hypothetical protein GBF38_002644 [Nibea albiflora]
MTDGRRSAGQMFKRYRKQLDVSQPPTRHQHLCGSTASATPAEKRPGGAQRIRTSIRIQNVSRRVLAASVTCLCLDLPVTAALQGSHTVISLYMTSVPISFHPQRASIILEDTHTRFRLYRRVGSVLTRVGLFAFILLF